MRAKLWLFPIAGLMLAGSMAHAASATLAECKQFSAEANKNFPQTVDKITVLETTECIAGAKKPKLVYHYKLLVAKSKLKKDFVGALRGSQTKTLCTAQKQLLSMVDISFRYIEKDGLNMGEINHSMDECAAVK